MPGISGSFYLEKGGFILDVDFEFPSEGITGLFGETGAGKSIFLRSLAGLEPNVQGLFKINNQVVQNSKEHFTMPPHRRKIGLVFQDSHLFSHLTVADNIKYGWKRQKKAGDQRKIHFDEVVDLINLEGHLEKFPWQLSGGERQAVALARSIAASPAILLLDEPLTALDFDNRDRLIKLIKKLADHTKIPIVYVDHSLAELSRLADFLILMKQGEIIRQDDINTVLTDLSQPLAWRDDSSVVISGECIGYDNDFELTKVAVKSDIVWGQGQSSRLGDQVKLCIPVDDIIVFAERPENCSCINIIEARYITSEFVTGAKVVCLFLWHDQKIMAKMSIKSFNILSIGPQSIVYLATKAIAIL